MPATAVCVNRQQSAGPAGGTDCQVVRCCRAGRPSPSPPGARGKGSRKRAFSLVEMVVALAIMSIIMVSIGSAVVLASRAIPKADDLSITGPRTAALLGRIADDLRYVLYFSERSAHAATWTVPDRDGDHGPETIRYAWSDPGNGAGAPLTRQYNGGPAVELASDVHDFTLTYQQAPGITETYPGPIIEDPAQTLLASHVGNNRDEKVNGSQWYGQYLAGASLALSPDAVSWRPAKVDIAIRGDGGLLGLLLDSIDMTVEVRKADATAHTPTAAKLAQQGLHESSVLAGSFNWRSFTFAGATPVVKDQPVALVVHNAGGGLGGHIRYDNQNNPPGLLQTSTGETGWEYRDNESLTYQLWGYQRIQQPDQHLTRRYLTAAVVSLQIGDDASRRRETAVGFANTPEVLDALWQTDFTADHATLDANGDGTADWAEGGAGYYLAVAQPQRSLVKPTTAYVRFRADNAGGAFVRLDVGWDGDAYGASLWAILTQAGAGQQRLHIEQRYDANAVITPTPLYDVVIPNAGMVDLRLLIDPTHHTVRIRVDDQPGFTCLYTPVNMPGYNSCVGLLSITRSQFEFIAIRVGGTP